MRKEAEANVGSIYSYYLGGLRQLFPPLTITNAACFSPDCRCAYCTDTTKAIIWGQPLHERDGSPVDLTKIFIDCRKEDVHPDSYLLNAQWCASPVARYCFKRLFRFTVKFPTKQISYPAFTGSDLSTLLATFAQKT